MKPKMAVRSVIPPPPPVSLIGPDPGDTCPRKKVSPTSAPVDWAIFRYSAFWGFLTTLLILGFLYLGYLGFNAVEAWMLRMERENPEKLWQYSCLFAFTFIALVSGIVTACHIYARRRV